MTRKRLDRELDEVIRKNTSRKSLDPVVPGKGKALNSTIRGVHCGSVCWAIIIVIIGMMVMMKMTMMMMMILLLLLMMMMMIGFIGFLTA